MPKPEIRRMKIKVDPSRRVRPVTWRRRAAGGGTSGARGAATDGPVGDVRKRLASSRPSSTDTVILSVTRTELIYTYSVVGNMPQRLKALRAALMRGGGAFGGNRFGGGFCCAGLYGG